MINYTDIVNFLTTGLVHWSWLQLLMFCLICTHLTIISVTVFLHRHQAHRALELHPLLSNLFRFWLWLTTGIVTKHWVAIHRKHHARCETIEDPHSPQIKGLSKVLWQGAELYKNAAKNEADMLQFGHGTPDDWIEKRLYSRFPNLGISLLFIVFFILFGTAGISVWALQMLWIPFWAAGVINGIGHYWGYRNFECADAATNIVPLGLLIGGEELHNNHHTYPSSAKLSNKFWEFDLGWFYIRAFQILGLAKVRKVAPIPQLSPAQQEIDKETLCSVVTHRFQIMSQYGKQVLWPVLKEEMAQAKEYSPRQLRKFRNLLMRHDNLLDQRARQKLDQICQDYSRLGQIYQYKIELQQIWRRSTQSTEHLCESLKQWCQEAEHSGETALAEFAQSLKQYRLPASS